MARKKQPNTEEQKLPVWEMGFVCVRNRKDESKLRRGGR